MEKINIKIFDIVSFMVFNACCITIYYGNFFSKLQIIFAILSMLYLIKKINVIFLKKHRKFNLAFIAFMAVSILSCIINSGGFTTSIIFFLKLFILLVFTEYMHNQNKENAVIKQYGLLYLAYVILSILVQYVHPELFELNRRNYLIGNKFAVSYAAFMSVIFLDSYRKNYNLKGLKLKLYYLLLLVFSILVCYTTSCNTGLICCALYILFDFLNSKKLKSGTTVLIVALLSSAALIFFRGYFLDLPIVKYIVVDVLHRNLTLSGRVQIYENMFAIIFQKKFLGYGYNNSYSILYPLIQAPNTQNALVEWWFNSGLIGLGLLLTSIYINFENMKKNYAKKFNEDSFIMGIYIFLILGSIEITIGTAFFVLLLFSNIGNFKESWCVDEKK